MRKLQLAFYSLFLLLVSLGCESKLSEKNRPFFQEVDKLFAEWQGEQPGGAVAIIEKGEVIYEQYFGLADLENKVPFSGETQTDIGSLSKQFTACLIALLEEENKLSVEDDIREHLSEFPFYGDTIRIKHLLHHCSGIKDYEVPELIQGHNYFGEHMTNDYLVQLACRQKSPNFPPNTRREYSNTNYVLLAEIAERVSGKKLEDLAQEYLFQPLGMDHTFFNRKQGADFEGRVIGYEKKETGYIRPEYRSQVIGDGGIFTTLPDLIRWDHNFYQNQLGKKQSSLIKRMEFREDLADGNPNFMAFAQVFTWHPVIDKESWSHGGSGGGYRTFYIRFEKEEFSIIVLSNAENHNAFDKAGQIVRLYFNYEEEKKNQQPQPENKEEVKLKSMEVSPSMQEELSGYYYDADQLRLLQVKLDETKQGFEVIWREDSEEGYATLVLDEQTLVEVEDTAYRYEFQNGRVVHKIRGRQRGSWEKLTSTPADMSNLAGKYYAEEIEHGLELVLDQGKLSSQNPYFTDLISVGAQQFLDKKTGAFIQFESENKFQVHIRHGNRLMRGLIFERVGG